MRGKKQKEPAGMNPAEIFAALALLEKERNIPQSFMLDKEGGVDILDCEAVSRKLSDLLDEVDPIDGSYTLEVGSAGAERALKRPSDFQKFLTSPVLVKLYRAQDGRKEFAGTLAAYDEATGNVTVTVGKQDMTFAKKDIALVRLRVEF